MRNMGFRWFGDNDDAIKLGQIRQIPGVSQVVTSLYDIPVGEVWPIDKIKAVKKEIEDAGMKFEVVESVNVHDDIKIGAPDRDKWIEKYKETIKNLGECGVKVICYNFMPVFDWYRTDLHYKLPDGSTCMAFEKKYVPDDPQVVLDSIRKNSNGFVMPGWEPDRLDKLSKLFAEYKGMTGDKLRENLKYFLDAIIPVCERYDVRMAMHPDDPPMNLFGLPRIYKNREDMEKIEALHESRYNGFTICCGSLGENPKNNVPDIIREFTKKDRVAFIHARNIKFMNAEGDFHESSALSSDGSSDMYEIMKALYDNHYTGYIRPDHGRDIWGEKGRPGYPLYDRALSITYLNGLWEAIQKDHED